MDTKNIRKNMIATFYQDILKMDTVQECSDYMGKIWNENKNNADCMKKLKTNLKIIEQIFRIMYDECKEHLGVFLYGINPTYVCGHKDLNYCSDERNRLRGKPDEYNNNNIILVGRYEMISAIGYFDITQGSLIDPEKIDFKKIETKIKELLKLEKLETVYLKTRGEMLKIELPYKFELFPYWNIRKHMTFPPKIERIQKYKDYANA